MSNTAPFPIVKLPEIQAFAPPRSSGPLVLTTSSDHEESAKRDPLKDWFLRLRYRADVIERHLFLPDGSRRNYIVDRDLEYLLLNKRIWLECVERYDPRQAKLVPMETLMIEVYTWGREAHAERMELARWLLDAIDQREHSASALICYKSGDRLNCSQHNLIFYDDTLKEAKKKEKHHAA